MAPCFLLLDNIEVVLGISPSTNTGGTRSTRTRRRDGHRTSHQAIDRILSTLLMEMDGIRVKPGDSIEETVIVLATSLCHPSELDSAIIRPGRLEEHIQILPPNELQVREEWRPLSSHRAPHSRLDLGKRDSPRGAGRFSTLVRRENWRIIKCDCWKVTLHLHPPLLSALSSDCHRTGTVADLVAAVQEVQYQEIRTQMISLYPPHDSTTDTTMLPDKGGVGEEGVER
jgi:SpoVK/Ycf46/Vps4 family AAA+-type ATPase